MPVAPDLNVMVSVPLPAVIVPFVIDHAYVAPGCTGTLAVRPDWFGGTGESVLMTAIGAGVIVTVWLSVVEQPGALETVTEYVCVAFTATTIVCVVAPVDQRYVAKPLPASRVTFVPAHALVGPVMFTTGGATIGTFVLPVLVQLATVMVMPSDTEPAGPAV